MDSSSSESEQPDFEVATEKYDSRSTVDYWALRGVKTLHWVLDVEEVKRRLNQIDEADRFHYLASRDERSCAALYEAENWDRAAIASLMTRSADSVCRQGELYCGNNAGDILFHRFSTATVQAPQDELTLKSRLPLFQQINRDGTTALHIAASLNRVEVADLIIRSADYEHRDSVIYCVDDNEETPLHKAISTAMAQTLLDGLTSLTKRQFIRHKNKLGKTVLHILGESDRVELAHMIIRSADRRDSDSFIYCVDCLGETPLHKAVSPAMAQTLLDGVTSHLRQQFIKHTDWEGGTALHRVGQWDGVEIADLIIRSADSENRDSVIYCVDGDGETPLHQAVSTAMAQTLLDGLTPLTKQQFIKHRNSDGFNALTFALVRGAQQLFDFLWSQSDMSTQLDIFPGPSAEYGNSLLMLAGWFGEREALRFLLDKVPEDSWEEVVTAANKQVGVTLTQLLIIHRMADLIPEVLKPLSSEKRRAHLAQEVKFMGYDVRPSSLELALIPAEDAWMSLRWSWETFKAWDLDCKEVFSGQESPVVLEVLHILTQEYCITSPASIIQCRFSSMMPVSPNQGCTQTSAVTVSMSVLFNPAIFRVAYT